MFLDEAKINVKSGDGGSGCISFRREKCVPRGGPDGGNGGHGGHIFIQASRDFFTLSDFKKKIHFKAGRGQHGQGSNKSGSNGEDLVIKVPIGTLVYDEGGTLLADLISEGQKVLVSAGGRGGRGNAYFKSSINTAPRFSELGEPGREKWIKLELRFLAEVGIIGFPNSGKSTLLSRVSKAKPRIADYPFTTLVPNLGIVVLDEDLKVTFADIPGLIEDAHKGTGLGDKFLRHIKRTKLLIHLVDLSNLDFENPLKDYWIINKELGCYSKELENIPQIVAGNKIDLLEGGENQKAFEEALSKLKIKPIFISALRGDGIDILLAEVKSLIKKMPKDVVCEEIAVKRKKTPKIEIKKVGEVFEIRGEGIERMVVMTDWDNDEALRYLQLRLKRMGLDEVLEKAGAKDGALIRIKDREFEYYR